MHWSFINSQLCLQNLFMVHSRRGGSNQKMYHNEWLDTIDLEPDVISLFLLPLTSLLTSIRGSGFVSHAINLYLRCKPLFDLFCCTNISLNISKHLSFLPKFQKMIIVSWNSFLSTDKKSRGFITFRKCFHFWSSFSITRMSPYFYFVSRKHFLGLYSS